MLDKKFISDVLKLQKICELPGASPTGSRPGIWPGSTEGAYSALKRPAIKLQ